MKATVYFLVEVLEDYNNEITFPNGMKWAVNNTIDSVEHINRIGRVVSAPKGSNAQEGDQVLIHHNICRRTWGNKGKKRQSSFYVSNHIYYVPITEIFMIMRASTGTWEALDPYVFVQPIPAQMKTLSNGIRIMEDSYKDMKDRSGIITFSNKTLEKAGVKEGTTIAFEEDSEYEFKIADQVHYRMKTEDILGAYEGTV